MRTLLSIAVGACFAYGSAVAQTTTFDRDNTSNLETEACPDYFDVDWGLTNDRSDPCWDAYLASVGYENLPRDVQVRLSDDEIAELDRVVVEREAVRTDRTVRMRNLYGPQFKEDNTSDLRTEPCPDYFDTDWGLVNQPGDPCWNAYITSVGAENVPRTVRERAAAAEVEVDRETMLVQEPTTERDTTVRETTVATTTLDEKCVEEDLSNQAANMSDYERALAARQASGTLSDDFNPSERTAKSVAQLRDSDIEDMHLQATFAALDDDTSDGINRIEALGVRGLADEFDRIDLNGDGVISEGEFDLYFGGQLAENEAICIDGERITSLSQVETRIDFD